MSTVPAVRRKRAGGRGLPLDQSHCQTTSRTIEHTRSESGCRHKISRISLFLDNITLINTCDMTWLNTCGMAQHSSYGSTLITWFCTAAVSVARVQ